MAKPRQSRPGKPVTKSRRGSFRDYSASREAIADGRLTEDELELLNRHFSQSVDNQQTWDLGREVGERVWRRWLESVLSYEVTLKAAAKAIVRKPDDNYRVEIQWEYHRREKTHLVKSVRVIADEFLSVGDSLPVGEHFAAFMLRVGQRPGGAFARAPRARPAAGQAANSDFYRRLLDSYEALIQEGWKNPALELARRMDVNHNTVKSWLRRGREYTEEE
jgi:hypothetical protein